VFSLAVCCSAILIGRNTDLARSSVRSKAKK